LPQNKNSNFEKAFDAEGQFSAGVGFLQTLQQPFAAAERIFSQTQ
jgi:hypothetical protein